MAPTNIEKEITEKSYTTLHEVLNKYPPWQELDEDTTDLYVRRIEWSIRKETIEECSQKFIDLSWNNTAFRSKYSHRLYTIVSFMDTKYELSNELIDRVISGELDCCLIAQLSVDELCPKLTQETKDIIDARRDINIELKTTHDYKCPRCGEKEAIPQRVQARAADEMQSISLTCIKCKKVWFIN